MFGEKQLFGKKSENFEHRAKNCRTQSQKLTARRSEAHSTSVSARNPKWWLKPNCEMFMKKWRPIQIANIATQHLLKICKMESTKGSQRNINKKFSSNFNISKCCHLLCFNVNPFFQIFVRKANEEKVRFYKTWGFNVSRSFSKCAIHSVYFNISKTDKYLKRIFHKNK